MSCSIDPSALSSSHTTPAGRRTTEQERGEKDVLHRTKSNLPIIQSINLPRKVIPNLRRRDETSFSQCFDRRENSLI